MFRKFFALIAILLLANVVPVQAQNLDDYKLTGVVVFSRHNIRSPLSGKNSAVAKITPHKWFEWTSAPGELSMRGGELETIMGQYFRKWLVSENLITENYLPEVGEVRFYSNSMQRTIATAQFFSSGLFPVANVRIEHKFAVGEMDPVFIPQLTLDSEKHREQVNKHMRAMFADNVPNENYRLLERVLDFKNSEMAKAEGLTHFRDENLELTFDIGKGLDANGTLRLAGRASDALTLQYYEAKTPLDAAFGHKISLSDWQKISDLKDFYAYVLYSAPAVAVNTARPLLQVINDELSLDRKFTFLCGHDSNIWSILVALDAEKYSLPQSIETKTPIGGKFVIEKWRGADGIDYAKTKLIYQSAEQLRNKTTLTLDNPPMIVPIYFKGLHHNGDGLYRLEDLQERFRQAIKTHYDLPTEKVAA